MRAGIVPAPGRTVRWPSARRAASLVKLRYKLNRRFTLQFQTGTNNALDSLYSWAFD